MDNYFGINLKFLRSKFKITQLDIAKIINKERSVIGFYEKGESFPPIDNIIVLANYFGITIDELLKIDLENVGVNVEVNQKIKDSYNSDNVPKETPQLVNEHKTEYNTVCKSCQEKERTIEILDKNNMDLREALTDCRNALKTAQEQSSDKRNSA